MIYYNKHGSSLVIFNSIKFYEIYLIIKKLLQIN